MFCKDDNKNAPVVLREPFWATLKRSRRPSRQCLNGIGDPPAKLYLLRYCLHYCSKILVVLLLCQHYIMISVHMYKSNNADQ